MQRGDGENRISLQISDQTITEATLRSVGIEEYNAHHGAWLNRAVMTGNVKMVEMLIRRFPTIVMDHDNSVPCVDAFRLHNLPILEALLKAGANLTAVDPRSGQSLMDFGFNLFLYSGKVWPFPKNWYRRCMKRILTLRPTDREDKAGYNFVLECTLKALCEPQPLAPGLDKLLLRLLQAGADPNAAKDYFYMLLDNPKPEIITLLRRYGANFNIAPPFQAGSRRFNPLSDKLVDYAHHLMAQETSSGRKQALLQCKSALELNINSGAELFYKLKSYDYVSDGLMKEMIANKECIFAYVLRLPLEEKIVALEDIIKGPTGNLISTVMWARRGLRTPDLTNGIRALAVAALAEAKHQQAILQLPAQVREAALASTSKTLASMSETLDKAQKFIDESVQIQDKYRHLLDEEKPSAALSTTAVLYPPLGVSQQPSPWVEPVPAVVTAPPLSPAPQPSEPEQTLEPVFIATNTFNAQIAELPDIREYVRNPPPPYRAPEPREEKRRQKLHS